MKKHYCDLCGKEIRTKRKGIFDIEYTVNLSTNDYLNTEYDTINEFDVCYDCFINLKKMLLEKKAVVKRLLNDK